MIIFKVIRNVVDKLNEHFSSSLYPYDLICVDESISKKRIIDATSEKLYTDIAHEIIWNKIDDPPERTTIFIWLPTVNTEVLYNIENPHLTPKNKYNLHNKWVKVQVKLMIWHMDK